MFWCYGLTYLFYFAKTFHTSTTAQLQNLQLLVIPSSENKDEGINVVNLLLRYQCCRITDKLLHSCILYCKSVISCLWIIGRSKTGYTCGAFNADSATQINKLFDTCLPQILERVWTATAWRTMMIVSTPFLKLWELQGGTRLLCSVGYFCY